MSTLTPGAQASTLTCPDGHQSLPSALYEKRACFNCESGTLEISPVWICDTCGVVEPAKIEPPTQPDKDELTILLETLTEIENDERNLRARLQVARAEHDLITQHAMLIELQELQQCRTAVYNDFHEEIR